MKQFSLALLAGLVLTACPGDKDDTGSTTDGGAEDGGADGGSDGGGDDSLYVTCDWDAASITIDIGGGDAAGYDFGMAETNGDTYAWTGEDCGYVGYTTQSGVYYDYCHDLSATGGRLVTGSFPDEASFAKLVEGVETVFDGSQEISYYMYEVASGTCWTWGDDTSYFFDCIDATGYVGGNCG